MTKITLNDITGTSSLSTINDNFDKLEQELNEKVLYRDNLEGEDNSLQTDIDANGKKIYNLPKPLSPSEPARLQDILDISATGLPSLAESVLFTPFGTISSTNVQDAIEELQAEVSGSISGVSSFNAKTGDVTLTGADISLALGYIPPSSVSPVFTGNPTAPTQANTDNSQRLATTQFVKNIVAATTSGVSSFNTRTGAVTLTSGDVTTALGFTPAGINSPTFVGVPTAPTALLGTNSTQIATTAFVANAVAASVSGVSSFNSRSGTVTLLGSDVVSALQTSADAAPVQITTTNTYSNTFSYNIRRNANRADTLTAPSGALKVETFAGAANTGFEWSVWAYLENASPLGENVAVYGQAVKTSVNAGGTWGACFEFKDRTNTSVSPTSAGGLGIEVTMSCNGTDNSDTFASNSQARRIGIDIVANNVRAFESGGADNGIGRAECFAAIRVSGELTANKGCFYNGLAIRTALSAGVYNYATSTYGIRHTGSYAVGVDLSEATHSSSAIRVKANDYIALDATGAIKFKFNPGNGRVEFFNGATRRGFIDVNSGADVDLAGGVAGAVDLFNNQTISGIKTFTDYIQANFGIVTAFIISNGDISMDAGHTVRWTGSGNVYGSAGSLIGYLRVQIDGTNVKIPYYNF
jgi:hypothetical protein